MASDSPCEYCGHAHDVRELCASRRLISRRRFFSLSVRALAVAAIAPQIADAAQSFLSPSTGTIGGIERATFAFWRNQHLSGSAMARLDVDAMRRAYDDCTIGGKKFQPADMVSAHLGLIGLIEGNR